MFEARTAPLESIEWDGDDGPVTMQHDGWTFTGAKRKDFFEPDADWESRLIPGSQLRFWTIQYSRVAGIEWWNGNGEGPGDGAGRWETVWFIGNDFNPRAEREASAKAYEQFVVDQGVLISGLINDGLSLSEIDERIDEGHSGNTYACALGLGIRDATNRDNAERVRREHNAKWGASEAKGTVNPAIMTLVVPEDDGPSDPWWPRPRGQVGDGLV